MGENVLDMSESISKVVNDDKLSKMFLKHMENCNEDIRKAIKHFSDEMNASIQKALTAFFDEVDIEYDPKLKEQAEKRTKNLCNTICGEINETVLEQFSSELDCAMYAGMLESFGLR